MKAKTKQILQQKLDRDISVATRNIDEEARTVEIAFSSEEPVSRWFGLEILDHSADSVRLDRLRDGAAVLVNHETSDQVGVVESAQIDDDRRGRAVIRFSRSARGQEVFQDVVDGIRKLVSVGYRIHKYEVEEREGEPDRVLVNDWEPFELSLVPIPADHSVGVGRSDNDSSPETSEGDTTMSTKQKQEQQEQHQEQNRGSEFDAEKERTNIRTEETKRISAIRALAEKHDLDELGREAISEGLTVAQFNEKALEKVGERNNAARSKMTEEADIDLSANDRKKFSITRLMAALENPNDRAAQTRAGFELEVCSEAEKQMPGDFNARGVYLPPSIIGDALSRDLTAGTATDGAELVATNLLGGDYIDVLRNNMVAMQAGARMLPGLVGDVAIPRQTSGAAMTWISAEDGDATESEPQFDQVTLQPKDAAVYTEVTRRLMQQSSPAIEGIVRNDLFMAIALGLDLAVFYGGGASGVPQGIDGATGVDDPTISSAAAPTYAELVTLMGTVLGANAMTSNSVFVISATTWDHASTTPKQSGGVEANFILNDSGVQVGQGAMVGTIKGRPAMLSTQLSDDDFVFGDFTNILIGEWGGLEINVDPYTHSLKGKTRFVAFKTCDIGIRHPEAFSFHNAA